MHVKAGVVQSDWLPDCFLQIFTEPLAAEYLRQSSNDRVVQAVKPVLTRMETQGLLRNFLYKIRKFIGFAFSETFCHFIYGDKNIILDNPFARQKAPIGKPGGHSQEVPDGDGSFRRYDIVDICIGNTDYGIAEFGEVLCHGVVQSEQALVVQRHQCGTGKGFRHGVQPQPGILGQRACTVRRRRADTVVVN